MTLSGAPIIVWPGKRTVVVMPAKDRPWNRVCFYTWNAWAASLCNRAYEKKQPITIQAEVTEHGLKIVHVELDQQEAAS